MRWLSRVFSPPLRGCWGRGAAPSACSREALHLPGWVWVKSWVFLLLAVDSFSLSWLIFSFVASAPSGSAVGLCPHSSWGLKPPSPLHIFSHLVPSSILQRSGSESPSYILSGLAPPHPPPFPPLLFPLLPRICHFTESSIFTAMVIFMCFPSSNIAEECLTSSPPVNPTLTSNPLSLPLSPPFFTSCLLSLESV